MINQKRNLAPSFMKILMKVLKNPAITFYIGFLIPIFIDVYIFSPITAPTVTATIASITLGLAIYAASKVNKWFSDKVKDKKFEKAHNFYDNQFKLYVAISQFHTQLISFRFTDDLSEKTYQREILNNIRDRHRETLQLLIELGAARAQFKTQRILFNYEEVSHKYTSRAATYLHRAGIILKITDPVIYEKFNHMKEPTLTMADIMFLSEDAKKQLNGLAQSFNYIAVGILKIGFEDMFNLVDD